MHDAERTRHDFAIGGNGDQEVDKPAGRRVFFGRPTDQPSPAPLSHGRPRNRRRNPGQLFFKALKRLWIILVILAVIAAGGLTVRRLHGMFGSEQRLSYADTRTDETKAVDPQIMRYEVFGPPGTLAGISYFDGDGDLKRVKDVPLPWSLEFEITPATAGGNIVAQGNSGSIGCRITIDGDVKAEKITYAASAFTYCRPKADE